MNERITLRIEVQVKKKTAVALKRLYESQASMTVLSKYDTQVRDVASAMMDDVLIDIRIAAKESIKQAIILWDDSKVKKK